MLLRILARSSWQFYRHHPAQLLLSIIGIVLGVDIVTAVLITSDSSRNAFALSTEALYGRTTHQLSGASALEPSTYVSLKKRFSRLRYLPNVMAMSLSLSLPCFVTTGPAMASCQWPDGFLIGSGPTLASARWSFRAIPPYINNPLPSSIEPSKLQEC